MANCPYDSIELTLVQHRLEGSTYTCPSCHKAFIENNSLMTCIPNLTAGRIPIEGSGGLLVDDSGLTYNSDTDTLTVTNLSTSTLTTTNLTASTGRTATYVIAFPGSTAIELVHANVIGSATTANTDFDTAIAALASTGGKIYFTGRAVMSAKCIVNQNNITIEGGPGSSIDVYQGGTFNKETFRIKASNIEFYHVNFIYTDTTVAPVMPPQCITGPYNDGLNGDDPLADDVHIHDCTFIGIPTSGSTTNLLHSTIQKAIETGYGTNWEIDSNYFKGVSWEAVSIGNAVIPSLTTKRAHGINVHDNTVIGLMYSLTGITVSGTYVTGFPITVGSVYEYQVPTTNTGDVIVTLPDGVWGMAIGSTIPTTNYQHLNPGINTITGVTTGNFYIFEGYGYGGIVAEHDSWDVQIDNNNISNMLYASGYGVMVLSGDSVTGATHDVTISNNHVTNVGYTGYEVFESYGIVLTGNYYNRTVEMLSEYKGLWISHGSHEITWTGGEINGAQYGVQVGHVTSVDPAGSPSRNIKIEGLTINGATYESIYLYSGDNIEFNNVTSRYAGREDIKIVSYTVNNLTVNACTFDSGNQRHGNTNPITVTGTLTGGKITNNTFRDSATLLAAGTWKLAGNLSGTETSIVLTGTGYLKTLSEGMRLEIATGVTDNPRIQFIDAYAKTIYLYAAVGHAHSANDNINTVSIIQNAPINFDSGTVTGVEVSRNSWSDYSAYPLSATTVSKIATMTNNTGIAPGEIRTYSGILAGTTATTMILSLDNPFGQQVSILSIDLITTTASAASGTLDAGTYTGTTGDTFTAKLFTAFPTDTTASATAPALGNSVKTTITGTQTIPVVWDTGANNRYLNFYSLAATTSWVSRYVVTVMGN